MTKLTFLRIAVALLLGAASLNALAAERTFVASFGLDTNACTRAAPCRTLQRAHNVTNAGGELIVLDSEGYGRLTINRSISIIAPPGVYAGISVFSGTGIVIGRATNIRVLLRGLTVNGQGEPTVGIQFGDDCAGCRLDIQDCVVKSASFMGIIINGQVEATLTNVRVENNGDSGILASEGANVSISHSVISGHTFAGVVARSTIVRTTRLVITDSVLSHNLTGILGDASFGPTGPLVRVAAARNQVMHGAFGIVGSSVSSCGLGCVQVVATENVVQDMTNSGIVAFDGATVVASRNTVANSATGLNQSGTTATFISMKDNVSELNTNNTNGTITPGTLR